MAVANAMAAGYITPGSQKTSMRGWRVSANTVEGDVLPSLSRLRAGSRDMWMNTPIAVAVLRRVQTNAVGFGLRMQSRIDYEALGISVDQAETWQRNVEREWRYWAESTECDSRRSHNFYELQSLALISELMNGDCFAFLPYIPRKGCVYDLRVQIIESDFICNPMNGMDSFKVAGGIEVDDDGAPIAYHMKKFPKDMLIQSYASAFAKWEKIPAYGEESGRRNVLHMFRADRPGQRRGVPFLAPVIEPLKNISRLSDSELQAAVIASFFTVFIKNIPNGQLSSGFVPGVDGEDGTVVSPNDPAADKLYEMGPGSIISLQTGEDVTLADPKRPNGAFEPFFLSIIKQIGAALEIPYEQVLLSYNASYSASRGAILEAWKAYKNHRQRVTSNICQPVYEAWLTESIIKGRVKAPGFLENPIIAAAWAKSKWIGPGQGMIQPSSEVEASRKLIDAGLSTYEEEYAERTGGDWEAMARTLSRERKLREELGLKTETEEKNETAVEVAESQTKGLDQAEKEFSADPSKPQPPTEDE